MILDRNLINRINARWRGAVGTLLCFAAISCFSIPSFAQGDDDEPQDAVAIFNEAQDLHEKGDLPGAIKLYDKALTLVEDFPEAHYQKGTAYLGLNRLDDAEASFRKAIINRPEWSLALAMLGDVLVRRHAAALESGNASDAKRLSLEAGGILTKAIELDANNFPAYAALADLQLHSPTPAKALLETLVKLRALTDGKMKVPTSIWSARAAIENAVGDKALARSSLKNALAVDPKNVAAIKFAAELALADSDIEQAASYAESLTKLAANQPSTVIIQARVSAAQGKPDAALKQLDLLKTPSAEAETLRKSMIASSSQDGSHIETLLEKDPRNPSYLGRLCSLYRVDAPEKAIEYCRRAGEIEQNNIDHSIGFGAALVQAKRFEQAVGVFRRIIAVAPDNSTVRVNLALALYQLKRYPEAKTEYQWIAAKMPENAVAHFLLAVTHDQLSEYLDAMANYQQFLRLADPVKNQLEIEKVNLRLPSLQKQIKEMKVRKS